MRRPGISLLAMAAWTSVIATPPSDQLDPAGIRQLLSTPPEINHTHPQCEIPIAVEHGKIVLTAEVNGLRRRFIFDTGSPTVLTTSLASALAMTTHGTNTGTDANGTPVTMPVSVADRVDIGSVRVARLPVLVFDPESLPLGSCVMDGGIIGSDVLPGSAWQIDLDASVLRIAKSSDLLPGNGRKDRREVRLHTFGYPHAPIIDYSVPGSVRDRALFDTGSPDIVTLAREVGDDLLRARIIQSGAITELHGFEGESAGGAGSLVVSRRYPLREVRIGTLKLRGATMAERARPPTLIGAGLLQSHIITLDYPSGRVLFDPRAASQPHPIDPGFLLRPHGDGVRVARVAAGSAPWRAGLRPGDTVLEVNGRPTTPARDTDRCSLVRWLLDDVPRLEAFSIAIERSGTHRVIAWASESISAPGS